MFTNYGSFYPKRENFSLSEEAKQKFTEKIEQNATELGGRTVSHAAKEWVMQ
jgi:hypothetical protein